MIFGFWQTTATTPWTNVHNCLQILICVLICFVSSLNPLKATYCTSLITSNVVNIKKLYTYICKSKYFSHTYMSTCRHTHMHTHTHTILKSILGSETVAQFSWKMAQQVTTFATQARWTLWVQEPQKGQSSE